jgi:hypothetical protein
MRRSCKGEWTPDHGFSSFQCPDHHQLWEDVQERHLRHGGDAKLPQGAKLAVERGTFVRQTDVDLTDEWSPSARPSKPIS